MHEFFMIKVNSLKNQYIELNPKDMLEANDFKRSGIIRFKDFISHHYEKLDTNIVFETCKNDLPILKQKIQTFLSGNNESF